MALQGNLRDFSAMEILQLVGSQKKSGCLVMEWNTERALVWVTDGRIVATRPPGLTKDDPLARFLRQTNRISDEQLRGLVYSLTAKIVDRREAPWYARPATLGAVVLTLCVGLNLLFW